jgi:membrane protease YdiL (CAAX protease family)
MRHVVRVALFWLAYLAILFATGMFKGMAPPAVRELAWAVASTALVLGLTLLFLRREKRAPGSVGLALESGSMRRFAVGLIVGFSLYGLHLLIVSAVAGPIRLAPAPGADAGRLVLAVGTYLALSSMEELGYRGYPLRTLLPDIGLWPAQAIVVALFSLNHILFGWTWSMVLLGVTTGGLLFGMAAIASRGLALPIGLHAAWNIGGWSVGEKDTPGLWTMVLDEGNGVSAGRVGTIAFVGVMLLGTAGFLFWHRSRERKDAAPASPAG